MCRLKYLNLVERVQSLCLSYRWGGGAVLRNLKNKCFFLNKGKTGLKINSCMGFFIMVKHLSCLGAKHLEEIKITNERERFGKF